MLKVNYAIPVLEDNDAADLNKYSFEMADALKTQLDKFGNPLIYKGQVKTIQDLPSDTQSGDIYSVISENKNYIWNGTVWVEYASTIDLTELENKTIIDKTTISGKTSQEGTPSPTNIVPIKNVNVYGVNEFDGKLELGNISNTGEVGSSSNCVRSANFILVDANTEYIMQNDKGYQNLIFEYDENKQFIKSLGDKQTPFTTSETTKYIKFRSGSGAVQNDLSVKYKLEKGKVVTPYTPYGYGFLDLNLQKDTDTQTVTLISKRLHEDDSVDENGFHYNRKTLLLDGSENCDLSSNGNFFYIMINDVAKSSIVLSNYYENVSFSDIYNARVDYGISSHSTYSRLALRNKDITTVDQLKSYLVEQYTNGTPVIVEYELAEQENELFNETNQTAWNTLENLLLQGYTFINSSSNELQPIVTLTEHTANEIHRENIEKFKDLNKIENTVVVKELWINPNPTSAFNPQDIILSDDDYDYLEVLYSGHTTNFPSYSNTGKIPKGKNIYINNQYIHTNSSGNMVVRFYSRRFVYIDDKTFSVATAEYTSDLTTITASASFAIPIKILGYKINK